METRQEFDKLHAEKLHETFVRSGEVLDEALSLMLALLASSAVLLLGAVDVEGSNSIEMPVLGMALKPAIAGAALLLLGSVAAFKFFTILAGHEVIGDLLRGALVDAYGTAFRSNLRVDYPSGLWALIVLVRQSTARSLPLWKCGFWLLFGGLLPVVGLCVPVALTFVATRSLGRWASVGLIASQFALLAPATLAFWKFLHYQLEELRGVERREQEAEKVAEKANAKRR